MWRRDNIRGGDPFSFPANGPRVRGGPCATRAAHIHICNAAHLVAFAFCLRSGSIQLRHQSIAQAQLCETTMFSGGMVTRTLTHRDCHLPCDSFAACARELRLAPSWCSVDVLSPVDLRQLVAICALRPVVQAAGPVAAVPAHPRGRRLARGRSCGGQLLPGAAWCALDSALNVIKHLTSTRFHKTPCMRSFRRCLGTASGQCARLCLCIMHYSCSHTSQVNHQVLLNTDYETRNSTKAALDPDHHVQAPDGEQATNDGRTH